MARIGEMRECHEFVAVINGGKIRLGAQGTHNIKMEFSNGVDRIHID